jgi:hypothetical protein
MTLSGLIAAISSPRPHGQASPLPSSLLRFVLLSGGWHQAAVCALSIFVFLLNTAPIETQRRIIDTAVHVGSVRAILTLVALQIGLVLAFGLAKLAMNVYRAWLGECATRDLRLVVTQRLEQADEEGSDLANGTGLAMILAEADDIGGFVGSSLSLPIVEIGFLASVFIYLAFLDLRMMGASLLILAPQFVFVPLMQRAINRRVAQRTRLLRRFGDEILSPSKAESSAPKLDEVFAVDIGIFEIKFSQFSDEPDLFPGQPACARHRLRAGGSRTDRDRHRRHLPVRHDQDRRPLERRHRLGARLCDDLREIRPRYSGRSKRCLTILLHDRGGPQRS